MLQAESLKRDPGTDAILWILRNFQEHLFCETPANGCFCILPGKYQDGEKFACIWFIVHSFDLIISELQTKEMLLIRLQIQNEISYDFN